MPNKVMQQVFKSGGDLLEAFSPQGCGNLKTKQGNKGDS
jgi:hypothetical protein